MHTLENLLPAFTTLKSLLNGGFFGCVNRAIHTRDSAVFAVQRNHAAPWGIVIPQHVINLLKGQGYPVTPPHRSLSLAANEAENKTGYVQTQVAAKPVILFGPSGNICTILNPSDYELFRQSLLKQAA